MRVSRRVLSEIAAHARDAHPRECCGILLATPGDPDTISDLLRADNTEPDRPRRRYLLDYQTQLEAVDLETAGDAIIAGYYHSHPNGGPGASPTDRELAVPDTTYVICGLAGGAPEYAAWRLEGAELVEVSLEAVPQ